MVDEQIIQCMVDAAKEYYDEDVIEFECDIVLDDEDRRKKNEYIQADRREGGELASMGEASNRSECGVTYYYCRA